MGAGSPCWTFLENRVVHPTKHPHVARIAAGKKAQRKRNNVKTVLTSILFLLICACTPQPIAPDAQAQISTLQHRYAAKLAKAHGICTPLCYVVAKDVVMADSERTASAIAVANEMMAAWETEK
jgi:hypothetical protein